MPARNVEGADDDYQDLVRLKSGRWTAVESHISRKTSEMWGTRQSLENLPSFFLHLVIWAV